MENRWVFSLTAQSTALTQLAIRSTCGQDEAKSSFIMFGFYSGKNQLSRTSQPERSGGFVISQESILDMHH